MERNSPSMKEGLPGLERRSPAAHGGDHGKRSMPHCNPWRFTVSTDAPAAPGEAQTGAGRDGLRSL